MSREAEIKSSTRLEKVKKNILFEHINVPPPKKNSSCKSYPMHTYIFWLRALVKAILTVDWFLGRVSSAMPFITVYR